jgi:hypothetical protein
MVTCGMEWQLCCDQLSTKDKNYQWNSETDPTSQEMVHWMYKEMQTNKKKVRIGKLVFYNEHVLLLQWKKLK